MVFTALSAVVECILGLGKLVRCCRKREFLLEYSVNCEVRERIGDRLQSFDVSMSDK